MTYIPIVFATDNNYIVPTITAITSLLENKKQDTFYKIFILDDKIDEPNKNKFVWYAHKGSYELKFVPVDLRELENTESSGSWVPTIYAKFFICDLLPEISKCIWLDGDTIILRDLTELYNTDLQNHYLAAMKSPGTNYNIAAGEHPVLARDKYMLKCINVGVLVMNLQALRSIGGGDYILKETLDTINSLPPKTAVTEQDMFNKLFAEKIVYLPLKYNCFIENINLPERRHYAFFFSREDIEEALNAPAIVHYTFKPWLYTNSDKLYAPPYKKYYQIWNDYYKLSPLGCKKLSRKRLGFFYRLYFRLKPLLKKSVLFVKIKRKLFNTQIYSPMHDFYY